MFFAALASAVYRSFVFSEFTPIRIAVVDAEQTASRRIVAIALPDLSRLAGQTPVLGFRLRNRGPEPKRIGLSGEGLPTTRVVLPPNRTINWDVVLSPEMLRALRTRAGNGQTIELMADADAWAVMGLEIRNYHVRWGEGPMAVALPARADGYTPANWLLPVAITLCMLAFLHALIGTTPQPRPLRLIDNAIVAIALLVCFSCLIVPRLSLYKVLLSPGAFWLIAAGLFARVLLHPFRALQLLARTVLSIGRNAAGVWSRHELTCERGAALLGLSALAIAQPIFEVVSNSPEFFPARGTPPSTALGAVLAICFGVPLVLLGLERAIRGINRKTATAFHGIGVATLTAALVMPWFRRGQLLVFPWDSLIAAFAGVAVALAYIRTRTARQFLTALAPAALVVLVLFFLNPGVTESFLPSESAAALDAVERTPPIVFVVFDELPMNSLLDAAGEIDAERYPNFAALARTAYWFRNASTVAYTTPYAVPAILSGRYATIDKAIPTLRYYPVNLFTVLARHYEIHTSMRFQQLCPPRACEQNSAMLDDSIPSLLSDLGLVWLHIVLPERLTEELPPVVGEWAEFGRTREAPAARRGIGRGGVFEQFVSSIDGRSARLHFVHLVLPHMPFEYVASGRRYRGPDYQTRMYRGRGLFEGVSAAYADTLHQRHLAQVGFSDRLVGDLIGRLREVGAYDKALVIITADHGASYREGRSRRQPRARQHNLSDVIQVPLLVKLPGQQRGEVVDRIVETVDILPTVLDVIGAKASLRLDGRSLTDTRVPERTPRTFRLYNRVDRPPVALGDLSADRAASLQRKADRFGSGDPSASYAPSGARHLLGTNVNRAGLREARDVQVSINNPGQFEAVMRDRDPLPIYVRGVLNTARSDPLNVVVVVNGIVSAIAHSYQDRDGHLFGTLIPETALRDGNNTVAAFVVDKF